WYVHTAPPMEDSLPGYLGVHSAIVGFAALLIGATFTAAELSTGALRTWLRFEPRRLRVYTSQAHGAALGAMHVPALAAGLRCGAATFIANLYGLLGTMEGADWAGTASMALRVIGLAVLAAAVGSALVFLLRHTAAVLGAAVVILIGEQILRGLVP